MKSDRDQPFAADPSLQRIAEAYANGFLELQRTSKVRPDLQRMLTTLPKLIADEVRKTLQRRGVLSQDGKQIDAANEAILDAIGPSILVTYRQ